MSDLDNIRGEVAQFVLHNPEPTAKERTKILNLFTKYDQKFTINN